jgi:hypothetical protein
MGCGASKVNDEASLKNQQIERQLKADKLQLRCVRCLGRASKLTLLPGMRSRCCCVRLARRNHAHD